MSSRVTTHLTVGPIREGARRRTRNSRRTAGAHHSAHPDGAGTAVLSSDSLDVTRLPLSLLPPGVREGSVIELSSVLKPTAAEARDDEIRALQQSMLARLQAPLQTPAPPPTQPAEGSRSTERPPHAAPHPAPCEPPTPPSPSELGARADEKDEVSGCHVDGCISDSASVSESGESSSAPYVPFDASRSPLSAGGRAQP